MLSEKMMEDAISAEPEKYLGEIGLKLIARQYSIGSYVFDLLFEDRRGTKMIVELQKGTLDRNHTYKILDYYDEYKERNSDAFIELMVVANRIPHERRRRLDTHGISWKEITESEFEGCKQIVNQNNKSDDYILISQHKNICKSRTLRENNQWDEITFFEEFERRKGVEVLSVAKKILEWAKKNEFTIDWGRGESQGGFQIKYRNKSLISVKISGKVTIWFYRLHHETTTFKGDEKKLILLSMLNEINGISISKEKIAKEPGVSMEVLCNEASLKRFLEILEWVTNELKNSEKTS